jgi:hypothetical protein
MTRRGAAAAQEILRVDDAPSVNAPYAKSRSIHGPPKAAAGKLRQADLSFASHRRHCDLELGITSCAEFQRRQRNLDIRRDSHAFHDGTLPRVPPGGR